MKTKTAHCDLTLPAMCMVVLGTASADTLYWDGNVSSANDTSDNSSTTSQITPGSFNVADAVAGSGTDLLVSSKIISAL
jgi:hypothetical protein